MSTGDVRYRTGASARADEMCRASAVILVSLVGAVGCTGAAEVEGGSEPPPATAPGETSDPNAPPSDPLGCAGIDPVSGHPTLRRLTQSEYENTVNDLFGTDLEIGSQLLNDDLAGGFRANTETAITELGVEKYATAAQTVVENVSDRLDDLLECGRGVAEDDCASSFISDFGARAFRRPLSTEEEARLFTLYSEKKERTDFDAAMTLVLEAMLQSPNFLYVQEAQSTGAAGILELNGYEMASRLSYFFWRTMPDATLFAAAETGELATEEGVRAQAERLLADPRAAETVVDFHAQWLGVANVEDLTKDEETYPEFTPEVARAAKEELRRYVTHHYEESGARLGDLFTSSYSFIDGDLASLYGVNLEGNGSSFERVDLDVGERSGLLTQIGLLATHADADQSSPIFRGILVREKLLCQDLPPPPPDVDTEPPEVDPNVPTRERFAQHRADPACSGCHNLVDPIGFGFENYDGIGRYRATEAGQPVDSVGEITSAGSVDGSFDGAIELGQRLAQSPELQTCVAQQWFRYALGRRETPQDACFLDRIQESFARGDYRMSDLMLAIATDAVFRFHRIAPEE